MGILVIFLLYILTEIEFSFGLANNCVDNIYMKIPYTPKLLEPYNGVTSVNTSLQCLELCKDHPTCKSVGIHATTMECYLYDDRVYAGLAELVTLDMIYYWLLEAECPTSIGYTEDPKTKICTKHHLTPKTWAEAQNECNIEGGHLLMLDTQEKKDVWAQYYPVAQTSTHMGCTDIGEEGLWYWLNGVPVNMAGFIEGEPNNLHNQDCGAWYHPAKGLDDIGCAFFRSFICEVPTKQAYGR